MQQIAIVILGAGASQRMGKIKQLLPWEKTTLLGSAITQAKSVKNASVFVVLGANASKIQEKIDFDGIEVLTNTNWQNGLGSSLACAVSAIENSSKKYTSLLVMLADQPLVDLVYLNQLLNLFETSEKSIVATQYINRVGVPAVFSTQYFTDLKSLNADFGAKALLKKYADDVVSISSNGKEKDVDTWEEYLVLSAKC